MLSINFGDERLPATFWDKCVPEPMGGCWLWVGATTSAGYGNIGRMRKGEVWNKTAHRVAYEALSGPVPAGLTLDHLCRVRCCVNPAHLEPVTHAENVRRGTAPPARHARATHCPRGHAYDERNTYRRGPAGAWRQCRACGREDKANKRKAA